MTSSSDQATETDPDESRGLTGTVTPSPVRTMLIPHDRHRPNQRQPHPQFQSYDDKNPHL
ncbi:MAG: hypothetical protein NT019_02625 [Candidatus Adlerbacteria bacterium]|nr:hypothetical protein [Candidatus Adlerbacteria bacterium]